MVKFLRSIYYLYLASIPLLATAALSYSTELGWRPEQDWAVLLTWMLGIALVGIYLMIESSRASFPTKLLPAIIIILGIILQYTIALWINDSIWNSFYMVVSLEILAFFLALIPAAITIAKAEGQIALRIFAYLLFLAAPLWMNWHWISNLFENIWHGIGVGIILASISVARLFPSKRTADAQPMNPDTTILFIALGTMAWTLSYFAFQFR
jgi:hypothetical protein